MIDTAGIAGLAAAVPSILLYESFFGETIRVFIHVSAEVYQIQPERQPLEVPLCAAAALQLPVHVWFLILLSPYIPVISPRLQRI